MGLYKFLRLFWVPKCVHRWGAETILAVDRKDKNNELYKVSFLSVSECSKCGEWKSFKV